MNKSKISKILEKIIQKLLRREEQLSEEKRLALLNTEESKKEAFMIVSRMKKYEEMQKKLQDDYVEYQRSLLSSISSERTKKIMTLQQIVESEKKPARIKNIFSEYHFHFDKETPDWRERRINCLYQLFLIFERPSSAETRRLNNEVLKWLAGENIDETIRKKGSVSMAHLFAASNNSEGLKWVFEWYRSNGKNISEIVFDPGGKKDIFNYIVSGIVNVIESCNYPEAEVIDLVLEEYAKIVDPIQKKKKIDEKKSLIKSLLLEKTDLTPQLETKLEIKESKIT